MYKFLISLFGLLAFGNNLIFAQTSRYSFTLTGTITVDTGKVELVPVSFNDYYSAGIPLIETEIVQGKFYYSGKTSGPCAFQILLKTSGNYISGVFYIDSGKQMIACNADSLREMPTITNSTMLEFKNDYLPGYALTRNKFDDYESRNIEINRFLLAYIRIHPNSNVALWQIVIELKKGYSAILDSAYEQLSGKVKNSYTGLVLKKRLKEAKIISIGQRFPELNIYDEQGLRSKIPPMNSVAKFTLIDFWFSHCPPCLQQFSEYKEIYKSFGNRGLKIIFISTDFKKDVLTWKKIIRDSVLNWPQYLDENGTVSEKLGIPWFPSNFLLDNTGEIIAKDLDPAELRIFLNHNCQ